MLFCSPKLQRELGLELPSRQVRNDGRSLGGWYAELFWCERRKCVLFVSDTTYLSFVVLDVFRSEMRPLDSFFLRYLQWYLKYQGLSQDMRDSISEEYAGINVATTDSSHMVDIVDELVFHARFLIGHGNRGGLRDVDSMEVSRRLSDIPIPALDVLYPWRAARIALGLEGELSAQIEVTSHHPLARRVGSPILTVISGGIS
jgi:hypothetical protein